MPLVQLESMKALAEESTEKYQGYLSQLQKQSTAQIVGNFSARRKVIQPEYNNGKQLESLDLSIQTLMERPWRDNPYNKQNWGSWLHSLAPYQGRMTPAMAHWLVQLFSNKGEIVFDPFAGIHTVPLEARYQGRQAVGYDTNCYAWIIGLAKMQDQNLEDIVDYLKNVEIKEGNISPVPTWIRDYFHDTTLKEIMFLLHKLADDKQWLLLASLIAILHGKRIGYLSVYTRYAIPMQPRTKDHPKYDPIRDRKEYRAVLPRLLAKVLRLYTDWIIPLGTGEAYFSDSRNLHFENNTIDRVISSPPYSSTFNYKNNNRVRLWFSQRAMNDGGAYESSFIQIQGSYLDDMVNVGWELFRTLKPEGTLVYVLGDATKNRKPFQTAIEVSKVYQGIGFEEINMVNDLIPSNKTASRFKSDKYDRILVMRKP